MEMDPGAIKNFRDFLQLYNKMSEICFARCINNVNSRKLNSDEISCVEDCSAKFIKFNNKLMQNFVKAQTEIVNRRVEEAEKQNQLQSNLAQPEQNHVENSSIPVVPVTEENQVIENSSGSIQDRLDNSEMSIAK